MKRIISLIIAIQVNINIYAQEFQWAKSAGGAVDDVVTQVASDNNGNIYVAGYYYSSIITFGNFTLNNNGSYDLFVVKYDAAGTVLWAKNAGENFMDAANSIAVDVAGNVYIAGYFSGNSITFGNITLNNGHGNKDVLIVKYDTDGNVIWGRVATGGGTNGDDVVNSIVTDNNSNVYITGYFESSNIIFGSTTLTNPYFNTSNYPKDFFVTKYDSAGNVLWAKMAGGNWDEIGSCVTTDTNGNVLITGYFESNSVVFGSTTLTNTVGGFKELFILKYDMSGNVLWAKNPVNTYDDFGNGIGTDSNGNVYVTGTFGGDSITFGSTVLHNTGSISSYDAFIAKYDTSGNAVWAKNTGGMYDDGANGIFIDSNNAIYTLGYFKNSSITFGNITLPNMGAEDVFVVKYDPSGNTLWAKSIGGISSQVGISVVADANDGLHISGTFQGTTDFNPGSAVYNLSSSGMNDIFLVKFCQNISASITAGGPTIFCQGDSVKLNANTGIGLTYQWQKSGTIITGATSSSYVATTTGDYSAVITNSNNCSAASLVSTVTVNLPPSQPAVSQNYNTLTCSVGGMTYQWYFNGTAVSGAIGQTYSPAQNGNYTVKITDNNGCFNTSNVFSYAATGIVIMNSNLSVNLYPNPNAGIFNLEIRFDQVQNFEISISTILGQQIMKLKGENASTFFSKQIDIKKVPDGIYLYKISNKQEILEQGKLIIIAGFNQ